MAKRIKGQEMMIIAIDLDNTIRDNIGELVTKSDYRLARSDFAKWDDPIGAPKMGMAIEEYVKWCWNTPANQIDALPFRAAAETIHYLRSLGNVIKIVTASKHPISKIVQWLDRWNIPFDEIVKESDKGKVAWGVLIDDSPITIKKLQRRQVIKFNLPWNNGLESYASINNWIELWNELQGEGVIWI